MSTVDAIRRLLADQVDAWNAGDARAWSAPLADDAVFINIVGMRFAGRLAAERRHAELFASIFKGSRLEMGGVQVRELGDSAIAEAELQLRGFARLPPGIQATSADGALRTCMTSVLVRDGLHWRIVLMHNTAVAPAPSAE